MDTNAQAGSSAHVCHREETVRGRGIVAVGTTRGLGRAYRPARAIRHRCTKKGKAEMIQSFNPELDLTISRVIKAPRRVVWSAWTDPAQFEQWWVPAPARCKVREMDLRPGGALLTDISENGGEFV